MRCLKKIIPECVFGGMEELNWLKNMKPKITVIQKLKFTGYEKRNKSFN